MIPYKAKTWSFSGSKYSIVAPQARLFMRSIERRTRRNPYVRSAYFEKGKIFFRNFWDHLLQLPRYQRTRRLKYLPCAIELIQKSKHEPITKENVDRKNELLHRFSGQAPNGTMFYVQIKENKRTNRKELMSVFPVYKVQIKRNPDLK